MRRGSCRRCSRHSNVGAHGYRYSENGETVVTVLDEPFQIALVERLRQVRVKRTYGTSVDLEPSGRLMLRIGSSYQNAGVADSPSRRVEDSLEVRRESCSTRPARQARSGPPCRTAGSVGGL